MIKNYTTSISEEKTVGEIMGQLAAKGARQIFIDYDDQHRPSSVSFVVLIKRGAEDIGAPVPFRLPCNFEGVFRALCKGFSNTTAGQRARRNFERNPENKAQARRIAWRIIKDWIEAQMALIEAEQATLAQVFLPYAVQDPQTGATMFDRFLEHVTQQKALPAPEVQP